jgi:hypothetical protein
MADRVSAIHRPPIISENSYLRDSQGQEIPSKHWSAQPSLTPKAPQRRHYLISGQRFKDFPSNQLAILKKYGYSIDLVVNTQLLFHFLTVCQLPLMKMQFKREKLQSGLISEFPENILIHNP